MSIDNELISHFDTMVLQNLDIRENFLGKCPAMALFTDSVFIYSKQIDYTYPSNPLFLVSRCFNENENPKLML